MQKTLKVINNLLEIGIIKKYAIAGGMAHFYYIEPSVTYDLDLIVQLSGDTNILNPLANLYEWANKNGYQLENEHIVIGGIPVQFLLAYNKLIEEALDNSNEIIIFNVKTYILTPEYLMAIMLQTGRLTDKERFARFLLEADFNKKKFIEIIKSYNLLDKYKDIKGEENE